MFDAVTEMVAHMIGLFQMTVEEGRARSDYREFDALRLKDPEFDPLPGSDVKFKAAYQLKDFTPHGRYGEVTSADSHAVPDFLIPPMHFSFIGPLHPISDSGPLHGAHFSAAGSGGGGMQLILKPPGSVVVIACQQNHLVDDDLLHLSDSGVIFVDPGYYHAQLQGYLDVAQAISPSFGQGLPALGKSAHEYAVGLHEQIAETVAETGDADMADATVSIQSGAEAYGGYENGVAAETLTRLDDVMPAFFRKDDDGTGTPDDDPGGEPVWSPGPFKGQDSGISISDPIIRDPGHEVVSGANTLVNQTNISFSWLDAPVIAVMGDVISLNMISQTNMLVEHGQFGNAGVAAQSAAYNSAIMAMHSSAPPDAGAGADQAGGLSPPWNWAVTRIDGDLLTVSYVQQYSFMTDFDRADITFNSANTYIDLGDNNLVNIADLAEIGYGYDLIIIGGHMITINQISQMNLLLDNDIASTGGISPAQFSAGDNLLFNGASISVAGVDSYAEMQDNFAKAAEGLAQGDLTIDEAVAHDSVFEGVDILRVLYVSGDVTTINRVDQTNVLGDSDQVHLALDNLQSATNADVTVTTGSNAAVNLASISQYGVDSTISVKGDVYDDALIYQAELIDTDANPTGVGLPAPLASEAVAFLADDMIGSAPMDGAGIVATSAEDAGNSPDMMQTMLA